MQNSTSDIKSLQSPRQIDTQTRNSFKFTTMAAIQTIMPLVDYGHRLIPSLVDEYAKVDPDYIFARIPKTTNFADGLQDITISTFARAVNEVAWRCESFLGKSTNFDTIAYIGPSQSPQYRLIASELTPSSGSQILGHCHCWC